MATAPKTETVVYVGIHPAVEIADTGIVATRDQPVEVPAELAGHGPSGDPPGPDATDTERDAYDPGVGLLAQPANWRKATKAETSKAKKADEPAPSDDDQTKES